MVAYRQKTKAQAGGRAMRWVSSLCLAGAVLSACAGIDSSEPEAPFDVAALVELTKALSADELGGRLAGTHGSAAARTLIKSRMATLGLEPLGEDGFEHAFLYGEIESGEAGPDQTGVNLIGRIEGTGEGDLSMVVTAHYDHIGTLDGEIYNGADDNASGVATLLAIAEAFRKAPPRHDVLIVAFDVEESHGHAGARDFVARPPIAPEQIAFNLNLDMLSRGDNGQLWASGTSHWPELVPLVETVAAGAPVELRMGYDSGDGRDDWTLLSDHAVFFRAGIPHLYLGVEDHPDYHKPSDDFDKIDQAWFARSAETAVRMARAADAQLDVIARMRQD